MAILSKFTSLQNCDFMMLSKKAEIRNRQRWKSLPLNMQHKCPSRDIKQADTSLT
ncbi:hypothetical protein [Psychrobacter sp. 16-MNA-CIBAN-0192]|uniref:hypothetical protein n=1 Tax=Psychrobacter sp. 16-MNA-CIBAN-0192 TaxID=3140448 RepID=UPI00332331B0